MFCHSQVHGGVHSQHCWEGKGGEEDESEGHHPRMEEYRSKLRELATASQQLK